MKQVVYTALTLALLTSAALAQDYGFQDYGQEYIGTTTPSASEPLFQYDDLEVWKHGWIQINPYEHGYHSYRPYNYKQVFSQSAQSAAWGMPSTMPYSQSYYLQHGPLTGINGEPIPSGNGIVPTPNYNAPGFGNPAFGAPGFNPGYSNPASGAPGYPTPAYGPTSMLREQPFQGNLTPQELNNVPGLSQLPGHQFPPQPQNPQHSYTSTLDRRNISPAGFQQFHQNPGAGPEYERIEMQRAHMLETLEQGQPQGNGPNFR